MRGKKLISLLLSLTFALTLMVPAFAAEVVIDNGRDFGRAGSELTIQSASLRETEHTQVFMEGLTSTYFCTAPVYLRGDTCNSQWDVYTLKPGVLGYEFDQWLEEATNEEGELEYTITEPGIYMVRGWFAEIPVRNNAVLIVEEGSGEETGEGENHQVTAFSDVPADRWSYNYIMLCTQRGAIQGVTAPDSNGVSTYDPNGTVTLGQFLAVLTRLLVIEDIDMEAVGESENWAFPYYLAAVFAGMIEEEEFAAEALGDAISREDMCLLLERAAQINGETLQARKGAEKEIQDFDTVSSQRQDAVLKAYSNGLITGYQDGTFGPDGTMTREQMAAVVCRLMGYAPRAEVD